MRRQIVIGNWKLHGNQLFVATLLQKMVDAWVGVHSAEVVVCPSFVHIDMAYSRLTHSNIGLGAQDASSFSSGAYTGDVSAQMLHDLGCQYVIVGHSERRRYHRESNSLVAKKFAAVQAARLIPIFCIGESAEDREKGLAIDVIDEQISVVAEHCGHDQLARSIIAYEPVWAVGSGKTATPEQAQEVHKFIRNKLGQAGALTRIVYGGSVTPLNAKALFAMPDIDGALVGGAALKTKDFIEICQAAELQ